MRLTHSHDRSNSDMVNMGSLMARDEIEQWRQTALDEAMRYCASVPGVVLSWEMDRINTFCDQLKREADDRRETESSE